MVDENQFQLLVARSESTVLDFKATSYDFKNDLDHKNLSGFIKDIICLCNTVRTETAYIITGIDEDRATGKKTFVGIETHVDDVFFQDKIKDKAFPRPHFLYYEILYNHTRFGIFEVPVHKYSAPVSPVRNIKGLEIGHIYYRHGTTNTEAIGMETIRIDKWLQSLPDHSITRSVHDEINECLQALTAAQQKLSTVITKILAVGRKYHLQSLTAFCAAEISGIQYDRPDYRQEDFLYRCATVFVVPEGVELQPNTNTKIYHIKEELSKSSYTLEIKFLAPFPIVILEEHLSRLSEKPEASILRITQSRQSLFPDEKTDQTITLFIFYETLAVIYAGIRQKAIDLLMAV